MRKMLVIVILSVTCAAILLPAPSYAQNSGGWHVESALPLTDLLPDLTIPTERIFLAPQADRLAYETRGGGAVGLCVVDITTQSEQCTDFPADTAYRFLIDELYIPLAWSPDDSQIAVVGMPYHQYRDTDLGLLHEGDFTRLVDDGFTGPLFAADTHQPHTVEIQPTFSPDGTQIAVEQTIFEEDGRIEPAQITLIDIVTGTSTPLSVIPSSQTDVAQPGSIFSMVWSPDGTQIAFSVRHDNLNLSSDGVWLVDVATGDLTRLLTVLDARTPLEHILPNETNYDALAPLLWSPDGTRLLFWINDLGPYDGLRWAFWIDLTTNDVVPVPIPAHPDDHDGYRSIWPIQAAWSPDGETLLVLANNNHPPGFDETQMLVPSIEIGRYSVFLIDVATQTPTLLGHLPYDRIPFFTAAWGPENHVIIGNAYLKLARD